MNRKVAKLIRGFCKMTQTPYRAMKRSYDRMSPEKRAEAKKQLVRFWAENEKSGMLDHRKYFELKETLKQTIERKRGPLPTHPQIQPDQMLHAAIEEMTQEAG